MRARCARSRLLPFIFALAVLAVPAPATASDIVTQWNLHATNALIRDGGQGAAATVHLAMVHGAVYDAVNAIDRRHAPYLGPLWAKRSFSQDAAAATAAYVVLTRSNPGLVDPANPGVPRAVAEATLRAVAGRDPGRPGEMGRRRGRRGRGVAHDPRPPAGRPLRSVPLHAGDRDRQVAPDSALDGQRSVRVAQGRQTVHDPQLHAVRLAASAAADERALRKGLRGGQDARRREQRGARAGPDGRGALLGRRQRGRHMGDAAPHDRRPAPDDDSRQRALLRDAQHDRRRQPDYHLGEQGQVLLMEALPRDPRGWRGRQRRDGSRIRTGRR